MFLFSARTGLDSKLGFCLALGLALMLFGCSSEPQKSKPKEIQARLGKVESLRVVECRSFPGEVESQKSVTLSSKFSGTVLEVLANEGAILSPGQEIMRIDDKELKNREQSLMAQMNQARLEGQAVAARASHAKSNLDRLERLAAQKVISVDDLEKARSEQQAVKREEEAIAARGESLGFQLKELKSQAEYSRVTAPFGGVLTRRFVDQGAFVSPGQPLAMLDDLSGGFELTAKVDESMMGSLKVGQTLVAALPGLSAAPFAAKVSAVVGRVDSQSRSFKLKLALPKMEGQTPKAGMFGRVFVPVRQTDKLLLPETCLNRRGDLPAAFALDEAQIAHLRVLKLGAGFYKVELEGQVYLTDSEAFEQPERERYREVLSGLSPGETLVCGDTATLREGYLVRPQQ